MQKKITGGNWIFLVYSLMSITVLVFSFPSYSLSLTISVPSGHNSVQQANAETNTPEVTSSGALSSHASSQQYSITTASTSTNNYLIYENPTYEISIEYPSSWEKIEYPRMGLAPVGNDLVANFLVPLVNASDHWREHFMIQILNQTQAKKLIPQSEITLAGKHGYKRVVNNTMEIFNLDSNTEHMLSIKTMEVWVASGNGDTCLLIYKAVAARYSDYLPTIQKMLDSFKIGSSTVSHNSTAF
ncbi:MAG: hypothetical protein DLM72_17600 [Candidatus Nitrosopolaris wilkensis]|nr:MAG: hypothetical protein DLM72_17600 [Candidatus Nitrosopolaris wilkensis]